MTERFNLRILYQNLDFVFPDFAWRLYSDHVYSNFDGLDLSISIYHREGFPHSSFLVNYKDKEFAFNDRDVLLLIDFDQLSKKLQAFEKMHQLKAHPQLNWADVLFGSTAKKA